MNAEVVNAAACADDAPRQRKRLEGRWFWIALLSFLGLYYQLSGITAYFTSMTGLSESYLFGGGFSLAIAGLMLMPPLAKKLGILESPGKFRVFFASVSAAGILAYAGFTVIVALAERPHAIACVCLIYLALLAPATVAGCALHRALKVISAQSAASFSGLMVILWVALFLLHMTLLGVFNYFIVLYISELVVYAAPLVLSVILLFFSEDDFEYTAPRKAAYFSDALYGRFMIAAALLMLMDMLHDGSYYAGGSYGNIFGMWTQVATFFLPLLGGCLVTLLLRRNQWFPAMAAVALLICFQQGLILFVNDNDRLAVAYAISSSLISSGPIILFLFIPIVFCAQRRQSATSVTGMVSLWLSGTVINALMTSGQGSAFVLSDLVTPAVTFVVSIAAVAYLFYLYSENNRAYIAALTAEFGSRDLAEVKETASKDDMLDHLGLTPREKEVCVLLLKSLSVKQIAGELGLAFATVNGYYRSLYRKLGVSSKAELFLRFGPQPAADPPPKPIASLPG